MNILIMTLLTSNTNNLKYDKALVAYLFGVGFEKAYSKKATFIGILGTKPFPLIASYGGFGRGGIYGRVSFRHYVIGSAFKGIFLGFGLAGMSLRTDDDLICILTCDNRENHIDALGVQVDLGLEISSDKGGFLIGLNAGGFLGVGTIYDLLYNDVINRYDGQFVSAFILELVIGGRW